ncbi:acyl-CoA dehydrogenase family protein [Bradyrhizobium sp. 131]|uniref:acyl-CoA dehydrogenase family protein n=1 Tax=Bradyrhizobium sp. 131 TaxID=2782609 RepID=UPI001FFEFF1E|nr:acyl-CoA dehydrogenase family protein [Bradyrhizobium sp. 131]UPK20521.1 acyl-CoA dehydrogenase family protein [Bradyrhizobium sp. 131]
MNFDLSDEQRLLMDSVERLMLETYGFDDRRRYRSENPYFSEAMWKRYAEMGLLALPFSEEHGGYGGGAIETMIVMEAFGKALILEPYFATVVLGGGILRHGASDARKAKIIPAVAEGRTKLAFAYAEPQSRYDVFDVETTAKKVGHQHLGAEHRRDRLVTKRAQNVISLRFLSPARVEAAGGDPRGKDLPRT